LPGINHSWLVRHGASPREAAGIRRCLVALTAWAALTAGVLCAANAMAASAAPVPCAVAVSGAPGVQRYTLDIIRTCGHEIRAEAEVRYIPVPPFPPYTIQWEHGRQRNTPGISVIDAGVQPKKWEKWGYGEWQVVRFRKPYPHHFWYFKHEWVFHQTGCCRVAAGDRAGT
jgi:hypothetical protein